MSDLRDEVEAAFNKHIEGAPDPVSTEPPADDPPPVDDPPEGDSPAIDDPPADPNPDSGDGLTPPPATPDVDASTDAPPVGWKAEEKAAWAKVPPELKGAILRREREAAQLATRAIPNQRFVESINNTIKPHAEMLKASGLNPVAVMQESLQLAHSLNRGSPQEKAETLGKMILHFGVDVEALDKFLVDPKNARPVPRVQDTPAYDPSKDARLAPLFSLAEQVNAKASEAAEKEIAEAEASWPGFGEHYGEMADLIDWAETRGQKMTLAQAYTRVTGNPVPAKAPTPTVPGNRAKPSAAAVSSAAAVLARSRRAASSVAGNRRTPPPVDTDDLRATIAAAVNGQL